jgi:hypothetical protein
LIPSYNSIRAFWCLTFGVNPKQKTKVKVNLIVFDFEW